MPMSIISFEIKYKGRPFVVVWCGLIPSLVIGDCVINDRWVPFYICSKNDMMEIIKFLIRVWS